MNQLVFDEDAAAQIEALYHIGDAVRRRRIVRQALEASPGERILDVGCGPGFYCAELLEEVGRSGRIVGVDSSDAMLSLAERRCGGHERVELLRGEAVALPVDDASFDGAICVQVLEYVADTPAAIAELYRAVRPGGRVVVWDVDWATVSLHSENPALAERVLAAWDEHLAHRSLPRTLAAQLRAAGFEDVRMQAHPFATVAWDPDSYGAALVPFVRQFVSGRNGVSEEDARQWATEQQALGERGQFYFASTQLCFTAQRPR
jgi:arsenite methyltransferase